MVDLPSAARTIGELQAEIAQLQDLQRFAFRVRQSGTDRRWDELSRLLQNNSAMFDAEGHRRKGPAEGFQNETPLKGFQTERP